MATTPLYDAFQEKVRDWANKRDSATVPISTLQDCIRYGLDEIYKDLRVPQLEQTTTFTVTADENGNPKFTTLDVPEDLIEFIYVAKVDSDGKIEWTYDNLTDIRSFLNPFAENYSTHRWTQRGLEFLLTPQLEVGDLIQLHYYRRLPPLDATYTVVPANYDISLADGAQPYLFVSTDATLYTPLYFVRGGAVDAVFATNAEATAYQATNGGTVTTANYEGLEAYNWLRDANERMVLYASLSQIGAYLDLPEMEKRYETRATGLVAGLNNEERKRKARGGNVQVNVNTGGLI
jgi:hypothetical protein